ncbi:nitrite reductase (NAD(P)H) small subunit [Allostreptomyces psammosilenae]|uniref:Nitrite reductase (NADH) small subunit n=1 Tax=Allostreptomyces psammosilenae TaxID=1892865 RepID=A0A853A1P3_9ACTN|nr:nitrite reductase (NAD(P)H) small subunit [Allostreptomyces psammosilenae]NYI07370.1 nitrite reductase (NADH) small subunit [Allostreptomyces psammosilenae]
MTTSLTEHVPPTGRERVWEAGSAPAGRPAWVQVWTEGGWLPVCRYDALETGRGLAVRVVEREVAVFRDDTGRVHALDNVDPLGGDADVSHGRLADRGDRTVVATAPGRHFALDTGECLQAPGTGLRKHRVRVH